MRLLRSCGRCATSLKLARSLSRNYESSTYSKSTLLCIGTHVIICLLESSPSFYACHIRLQCRLSLDFRLEAVSVVVSRSHIALVKQNPQWPAPRYTEMPQDPKGPAFLCLAKHKITDVTSLVGTFHVHLPLHGQFNRLLACSQTLYFLFRDRRARV